MGNAIFSCGKPKEQVLPVGVVNTNTSNSVRVTQGEKMRALQGIINNDGSRRALMKYLQKHGLEASLNYYFEIEELHRMPVEKVFSQLSTLRDRYQYNVALTASAKIKPGYESSFQNWKGVSREFNTIYNIVVGDQAVSACSVSEVLDAFKESQDKILSQLAVNLDDFLLDPFYKNWEESQRAQEHHNFERKMSGEGKLSGILSEHIAKKSTAPSAASATASATAASSSSSAPPVPPPLTTRPDKFKNILVVDDSKIATKIASLALSKVGHQVAVANHGREALEMLTKTRFQIILVDLYMPIMDGFETVSKLREYQRSASVASLGASLGVNLYAPSAEVALPDPSAGDDTKSVRYSFRRSNTANDNNTRIIVIGMSSDTDAVTVAKAVDCGVDYFMNKPFSLQRLSEVVNEILIEDGEVAV